MNNPTKGEIVDNQAEWRRMISFWIAAICVTAVICSWQSKGYRYEPRTNNGFLMMFDKTAGKYYDGWGDDLPPKVDE